MGPSDINRLDVFWPLSPIHTGCEAMRCNVQTQIEYFLLSMPWECSHWMQATSKELPANLRARIQTRTVPMVNVTSEDRKTLFMMTTSVDWAQGPSIGKSPSGADFATAALSGA